MFHKKLDFFINFIMRGMLGFLSIYVVNEILERFQIYGEEIKMISYNVYTFGITGVFGIPGVALLYGIQALINR